MTKIVKTLAAATLAIGLALSASTGASAAGTSAIAGLKGADVKSSVIDVRRRGWRRGRNIGLGILGAAAAAAIISGAARAERHRYRYRDHDRCEYYDYKCSQGYGWACHKFDRYCY